MRGTMAWYAKRMNECVQFAYENRYGPGENGKRNKQVRIDGAEGGGGVIQAGLP